MKNLQNPLFKVGDLVYCSAYSASVCQIRRVGKHTIGIVRLSDSIKVFDIDDCSLILCDDEKTLEFVDDDCNVVRICHATQENYELLSKLYPNVTFEPPPKPKEPKDVIQAIINSNHKFIACINKSVDVEKHPLDGMGIFSAHTLKTIDYEKLIGELVPFDLETGKVIVDFVDGKPVLESGNAN